MAGIGHNGGPEMAGVAWRTHCWTAARARLLPVLPIEVVRLRVKRAAELGLDYKTYAGVRAATGHDIIAFLFSSNALRIDAAARIPAPEAARLGAVLAGRIALAQGLAPDRLAAANVTLLDAAHAAPRPYAAFGQSAAALRSAMGRLPGDQVVLIASDAPWEREWLAAGKLAGMIPADRYFARAS
ncbi:hypothetical protein [Gemmobacter sp.]|uniref:hypothetical protein n=1 Tax=Gemmobacter sp. TaxID=1898957 RepID=UPI002AFEE91D|nr:hypothetical protein [Gemmobacter sp.]